MGVDPTWGYEYSTAHPESGVKPKVRHAWADAAQTRKKLWCNHCWHHAMVLAHASDAEDIAAGLRQVPRTDAMIADFRTYLSYFMWRISLTCLL